VTGSLPSAVLLVVLGVWLLLQTLAGDLPGRILSWRGWANPSDAGPPTPSSSGASGFDDGTGFSSGGAGGGGGGSW
jgi:hypothetical protein